MHSRAGHECSPASAPEAEAQRKTAPPAAGRLLHTHGAMTVGRMGVSEPATPGR